jgi:hypothetical protein
MARRVATAFARRFTHTYDGRSREIAHRIMRACPDLDAHEAAELLLRPELQTVVGEDAASKARLAEVIRIWHENPKIDAFAVVQLKDIAEKAAAKKAAAEKDIAEKAAAEKATAEKAARIARIAATAQTVVSRRVWRKNEDGAWYVHGEEPRNG